MCGTRILTDAVALLPNTRLKLPAPAPMIPDRVLDCGVIEFGL